MGRWHLDASLKTGARVMAIADPEESVARSLAGRCRGAIVFTDALTMLESVDLDVLHICSPLGTHADLTEAALAGGVSVLVEKPLAPDLDTTLTLLDRASSANLELAPVHQFPFQRGFQTARSSLARSGSLRHVEFCICSAGGVGQDEVGRRALAADVLPHPLSVTRALLATDVAELGWRAESPAAGELRLHARSNEVTLEVLISCASRPTENSMRIRGDDGCWDVDFFHGYSYRTPGGVSRRRKISMPFERAARSAGGAAMNLARRVANREPAYPGLRSLVAEFHSSVRGECAAPIPPSEIADLARTRDAILSQVAL